MYKNQLQELAQRSCFNLPSYACIREGPDHAPRFKATVNFSGDVFESPTFCTTLRQAEHAAAEVALSTLSKQGPSRSLAARVLDETGVYKNLLQETAHRAGVKLPFYTTVRSGPGHTPTFSCTIELSGMTFGGEPAKTKKQAQKNAAMAAWSALKQLPHMGSSSSSLSASEPECNDEQDQVVVARLLASLNQSESTKPSPQSHDRQYVAQRRPAPVQRESNPTPSHSYYPIPCHSWIYSGFSSEAAMYQMWQQVQASQQQNHLLTIPDPRFLPIVRSVFQPVQGQFFPGNVQNSISPPRLDVSTNTLRPTYFSDYSLPGPTKSPSQVAIKEMHEDSTPRSISLQSDAASISDASPDREPTDNAHRRFSQVMSELDPSMVRESGESSHLRQKQRESQRNSFERVDPRVFGNTMPASGVRCTPPAKLRPNLVSAPMRSGPGTEVLRPRGSTSMAFPVRIRSAVPVCSARPGSMDRTRRNFMAPAVNVRTVVPVCSAPPAKTQNSTQKSDQEAEDTKVNSDFGSLHI